MVRIPEVARARRDAEPRVGWYPILLKSFALAAMTVPELRRSLSTFPYPRLHEHAYTVAAVTAERELPDGPAVLAFQVNRAETLPLIEIAAKFHRAKTAPVWEVDEFRRILRFLRLPLPLRRLVWWYGLRVSARMREKHFGTFAVTSTATAGGVPLTMPCVCPVTWTFGRVGEDGSLLLRLAFDHLAMDGVAAARGLVEAEAALNGPILGELRALGPGPKPLSLAG